MLKDFQTSEETQAFDAWRDAAYDPQASKYDIMAAAWVAARDYFSQDAKGSAEGPAPDAQRLRELALSFASGHVASNKVVDLAQEYLSFLKGESDTKVPFDGTPGNEGLFQ